MNKEQLLELREYVAALADSHGSFGVRMNQHLIDIEAGKYSAKFMEQGISKREAVGLYRGRAERALTAEKDFVGLLGLIDTLSK